MKKICLFILCLFALPLMFLFGGCSLEKEIEIRVTGEYVQWSYQGENLWHDIIDIASIKSALGETYKGDAGEPGLKGDKGIDGKQVEFRRTDDYIQWHYVGEETWNNLISVEELKTDTSNGNVTDAENPQCLAFYPLDDGTYGVGVGNATELSHITIPETYLGRKVSKILDYGFYNLSGSKFKSISLSNNITTIGDYAFRNCESLISIEIPNSITKINDYVFDGCTSLTSITIPNSVTSIGENAFLYCDSLTKVKISSIENWLNISFTNSNPLHYAKHLYVGDSEITSIEIPNTITKINDYVFDGCTSLTSITIPNSMTSIGGSAFCGCRSLMNVTIPDSVTSIGNCAFYNCSSLTSITIGNSVTSIDSYAFRGCGSLKSVTIPSSVTSIGESAFYDCNSLTTVVFENTSGWKILIIYDEIIISSSDLSNSSTAATYLTNTYSGCTWTREG